MKKTNKIVDLVSSLIEENRYIKSQFMKLQAAVQASQDKSQELAQTNKQLKEELAGNKSDMRSLKNTEDSKYLSLSHEISDF